MIRYYKFCAKGLCSFLGFHKKEIKITFVTDNRVTKLTKAES